MPAKIKLNFTSVGETWVFGIHEDGRRAMWMTRKRDRYFVQDYNGLFVRRDLSYSANPVSYCRNTAWNIIAPKFFKHLSKYQTGWMLADGFNRLPDKVARSVRQIFL